jgi:biotin carboxylase
MGLPHNRVEAVQAAADKATQRRRWTAAGVAQPAFRILPADASEDALQEAAAQVGYPCVVKAVSLSGSQGVLRADDGAAAADAARRIRQILRVAGRPADEPLLVEAYIPGWELSVDGLPSRLPQPILSEALRTAEHAAEALGLRYGPIHAELRLDTRHRGQRPTMLELAARSIGGLCSRALCFLDGASLEQLVLANALGRRVTTQRLARPAGVLMLPVERAGVLQAVHGRTQAAAVPSITGLSITIPVGQPIRPLPEGDRYLGFVFAQAATHQEVQQALYAARRRLRVVIR